MKKFLAIVAFLSLTSFVSHAQHDAEHKEENFATRKKEVVASLNEQKAAIDQMISCVNSAQDGQAIKKCHEIREVAARNIQKRNIASRKAELQNQMNQLNEREAKLNSGNGR